MNRLVVAGGVMVIEVATHAVFAGTQSSATWWSIAIPTLLGAGPSVYKAADACGEASLRGKVSNGQGRRLFLSSYGLGGNAGR